MVRKYFLTLKFQYRPGLYEWIYGYILIIYNHIKYNIELLLT